MLAKSNYYSAINIFIVYRPININITSKPIRPDDNDNINTDYNLHTRYMVLLIHYSTTMIYRTTKTTKRVNYKRRLRLKTGKLQMEVQNGKEYDWIKIEELLQPSARISNLQWIWQTATS
jgi:hypothetical protein